MTVSEVETFDIDFEVAKEFRGKHITDRMVRNFLLVRQYIPNMDPTKYWHYPYYWQAGLKLPHHMRMRKIKLLRSARDKQTKKAAKLLLDPLVNHKLTEEHFVELCSQRKILTAACNSATQVYASLAANRIKFEDRFNEALTSFGIPANRIVPAKKSEAAKREKSLFRRFFEEL